MSGTFMLTRPGMRMPRTGRVYAANLGHRKGWSRDVQAHIDDLGHTKSLRYIGTPVSDVHRTLLYGGVFLYLASMKRPQGKIRLIYEAPLAFCSSRWAAARAPAASASRRCSCRSRSARPSPSARCWTSRSTCARGAMGLWAPRAATSRACA